MSGVRQRDTVPSSGDPERPSTRDYSPVRSRRETSAGAALVAACRRTLPAMRVCVPPYCVSLRAMQRYSLCLLEFACVDTQCIRTKVYIHDTALY